MSSNLSALFILCVILPFFYHHHHHPRRRHHYYHRHRHRYRRRRRRLHHHHMMMMKKLIIVSRRREERRRNHRIKKLKKWLGDLAYDPQVTTHRVRTRSNIIVMSYIVIYLSCVYANSLWANKFILSYLIIPHDTDIWSRTKLRNQHASRYH